METHYASIWEAISDSVPDATAISSGRSRRSWAEHDNRSARLATAFAGAGLAVGDKVGLLLYNCPEYAETQYAAFKQRLVPININYRYRDDELAYLLNNSDACALVFHSSLADRVAAVSDRVAGLRTLIQVNDGGGDLDGALRYEDLINNADPAPRIARSEDDEVILYTGGTTGLPKGVRYPMGAHCGMFLQNFPMILGLEGVEDGDGCVKRAIEGNADGTAPTVLSAVPLMHGQGLYMGLLAPHLFGGTSVLLEQRTFDPMATWAATATEQVQLLVIVGDAIALPLVRALDAADAGSLDLSRLKTVMSSGAMFSAEVKRRFLDHLPHIVIADGLGSTEAGIGVSFTMAGMDTPTGRFMPLPGTKVFDEDGNEVQPGSGVVGRVAAAGGAAIGYYRDDERSAATFPVVDGVRYTIAGDHATIAEDGSIVLLGRGSGCINTGGEKVFPEEVEEALKRHPSVDDALVFGIADELLGQRIVAIASAAPSVVVEPATLIEHVRTSMAGYKAPKKIVLVDEVPRTPTGKPDYETARSMFAALSTV